MNLSIKIFLALVLSVVVGLIAGPDALPFIKWWIAPIGTMFINLIKMMIVPVVFTSLIVGASRCDLIVSHPLKYSTSALHPARHACQNGPGDRLSKYLGKFGLKVKDL